MKIKLYKTYGNLNPLPIMGKDAFLLFLEEWIKYKSDLEIRACVDIPNSKEFYRIFKLPGSDSNLYVWDKDWWKSIATIRGYCNDPNSVRDRNKQIFDLKDIQNIKERCELSNNFIFTNLINRDEISKNVSKELIDSTKKMIYERSALVHKGLFGNYSL